MPSKLRASFLRHILPVVVPLAAVPLALPLLLFIPKPPKR